MTQAVLNTDNCPQLTGLLGEVASAIADSLSSLIDEKVDCRTGELDLTSVEGLQEEISGASVIVRGSLGDGQGGKLVRFVIDAPTATTLAASMMMVPKEAFQGRGPKEPLSDEELEALGDVANVICSGAGSAIRKHAKDQVDLRLKDHKPFDTGSDSEPQLGEGPCVRYRFPILIENCPESTMHVILDTGVAELFNGKPLHGLNRVQPGEEAFEEIPEAVVRGTMAAYVVNQEVLSVLRRTCRRVGLELERFPGTAIPNPAAHRGQVVLMDVPAGEEKQFDWCQRLARDPGEIKTVLVIHHPTKPRVLKGFKAKADAILGWPLTEALLSRKVDALLDTSPFPGLGTARR